MATKQRIRSVLDDTKHQYYTIRKSSVRPKQLEIHLLNDISSDAFEYDGLFYRLGNIPNSITSVRVLLGSLGGCCETAFAIVHAIQTCRVPVHIIVLRASYSMGAIIALSGASLTIAPGAFLMFHNYSQSHVSGKGLEFVDGANHWHKHWIKEYERLCHPFLTKAELKRLTTDRDLYIDYDDPTLVDRIDRHFYPSEE